ncbi:MAG: hypothetical protein R3E01_15815 [Pirellulaceae bacterium]|nr:hypothetical protein [Planctomycetales bacterium]
MKQKRKIAPDVPRRFPGQLVVVATVLASLAGVAWQQGWFPRLAQSPMTPQAIESTQVREADIDPRTILQEMIAAYRNVRQYRDRAMLRLRTDRGGRVTEEETVVVTSFSRPNRIALDVHQGPVTIRLVSDGKVATAQVSDPSIRDFDHQVVERPAPAKLTVPELYSMTEYVDPARPEELRSLYMGLPVPLSVGALELLLTENPWPLLLSSDTKLSWEGVVGLGQHKCHVIGVSHASGDLRLWVDERSRVLHRVELPRETVEVSRPTNDATEKYTAQVIVDFEEVQLDGGASEGAYRHRVPTDARQVRHFVLPPQEDVPQVLGKRIGDYWFTGLDDQQVGSESLDGRLAVLVWFNDHPASAAVLQQIQAVFAADGQEDVAFLGVCTEPMTAMSHRDIENLRQRWGLEFRVVRDLSAVGRDLFHIDRAPTMVVLSPQRQVQLFEVGGDQQLQVQLPVVLDKLRGGERLADAFMEYVRQQQVDYQQRLAASSVKAPVAASPNTEAAIAPATLPQQMMLKLMWESKACHDPGNICVHRIAAVSQFLVNDGWDGIVRLDRRGRVLGRYTLALPENSGVQWLRMDTDSQGRTFALALARRAQQLFLFDEAWRLVATYPHADRKHNGIDDALLADLDGDGHLEGYVVFAGPDGIERIDLRAQKLWANRMMDGTSSIATVEGDGKRTLLATGASGNVVPLGADGRYGTAIAVGSRAVFGLHASVLDDLGRQSLLGLSYTTSGDLLAIGLSSKLQEQWTYPLPSGAFANQLQFVTSVALGKDIYWGIAAPDGSIHVIRSDGGFHDHFALGVRVDGIQMADNDGRLMLVVSNHGAVHAYELSFPQ